MKTLVGIVLGIHHWPGENGNLGRAGIHLQITNELVNGTDLRPLDPAAEASFLPGTGVAIVMARLDSGESGQGAGSSEE
ncbi:MAG TPA: hypothetical protein VG206_02935 [Terriglobia bacterium]|nr:hypothetical protein [Terriglobia bacterium]